MHRVREYRNSLILAAALVGAGLVSGCDTKTRVVATEAPQPAGHHWDEHEDAAYRRYAAEQHRDFTEYDRLGPDEQRAYWGWRANHPG